MRGACPRPLICATRPAPELGCPSARRWFGGSLYLDQSVSTLWGAQTRSGACVGGLITAPGSAIGACGVRKLDLALVSYAPAGCWPPARPCVRIRPPRLTCSRTIDPRLSRCVRRRRRARHAPGANSLRGEMNPALLGTGSGRHAVLVDQAAEPIPPPNRAPLWRVHEAQRESRRNRGGEPKRAVRAVRAV
jgi:hypothetical protein